MADEYTIKVETKGLAELRGVFEHAAPILEATLPQLAMEAGQDVVDYAQYLFRLPKSGNPRKSKDGSGRIMIGSAPGEAPAIDTGKLDTSMTSIVRDFTVTVNRDTPTEYADYLEEKLNRPFMKPAHDFAADRYYANVLALLQRIT